MQGAPGVQHRPSSVGCLPLGQPRQARDAWLVIISPHHMVQIIWHMVSSRLPQHQQAVRAAQACSTIAQNRWIPLSLALPLAVTLPRQVIPSYSVGMVAMAIICGILSIIMGVNTATSSGEELEQSTLTAYFRQLY